MIEMKACLLTGRSGQEILWGREVAFRHVSSEKKWPDIKIHQPVEKLFDKCWGCRLYVMQARIQDFLMGSGWYSRPPNYTLVYYTLSDVWPQIWRFWWFWLLRRELASHPIHPPWLRRGYDAFPGGLPNKKGRGHLLYLLGVQYNFMSLR